MDVPTVEGQSGTRQEKFGRAITVATQGSALKTVVTDVEIFLAGQWNCSKEEAHVLLRD